MTEFDSFLPQHIEVGINEDETLSGNRIRLAFRFEEYSLSPERAKAIGERLIHYAEQETNED